MELLLKVISPDGRISLRPLDGGRIEIDAAAGARYQLILDQPGQSIRPRVLRLVDDLVVDGLPSGEEIQLTNFFTACKPQASCRLEVYQDGDSVASALITPASEPIAAITGGGFIMAEPGAPTASLPVPPEAESGTTWRPIMAGVAGLVVVSAAAGGGGGAGAADTTAPARPVLASDGAINSRFPDFSGSAEAGSAVTVTVTLADGSAVRYATVADAQGNWRVATASDQPNSGVLPADGLPENAPVTVEVVAVDLSGNVSDTVRSTLQIDAIAPGAPTVVIENRAIGSEARLLSAIDLADGLLVSGVGEAGSSITIGIAETGAQRQATIDANGQFSVMLGTGLLPAADGQYTLTAQVTDRAGNTGPAASVGLDIDRTLSALDARITTIVDDRAPQVGELAPGASSNDSTPTLRGTVSATPAADEQLLMLADGVPLGTITTQDSNWEFTVPSPLADGTHTFTLRLVDDAGNSAVPDGASAQSLTIDTVAPTQQPTISAVLADNNPTQTVVPNGSSTTDPTLLVRVSLENVLDGNESINVLRTDSREVIRLGAAVPVNGSASSLIYEIADNTGVAPTGVTYQAVVVDGAGLNGPASGLYSIQIVAPSDVF
ncbi:MAG: Ig-like domain-containing protein [Burkholderiaceae bacterium]